MGALVEEHTSATDVAVFQVGQFDDKTAQNSTFETGDWNGDREFDSSDLVLAFQAGHYTPKTLTADLELLRHEPQIWLTGMKPGEEATILEQVRHASPERDIQMLARGTVLTI